MRRFCRLGVKPAAGGQFYGLDITVFVERVFHEFETRCLNIGYTLDNGDKTKKGKQKFSVWEFLKTGVLHTENVKCGDKRKNKICLHRDVNKRM